MSTQGSISAKIETTEQILNNEVSQRCKELLDNSTNLERVAQYCEDVYVNATSEEEKNKMFNETKDYTSQALASIAYQINQAVSTYLDVMDNQMKIMDTLQSSLSQLDQEVKIHREKVSRREIGSFTSSKQFASNPKMKKPEIEEETVKYVRKPINYNLLDDIGHGLKDQNEYASRNDMNGQNSFSSTQSSSSYSAFTGSNTDLNQIGTHNPVTSPMLIKANITSGHSSIRSNSSNTYQRAPILPPTVPSEYLSRQELGIYSSRKELGNDFLSTSLNSGYQRRISQTSSISLNKANNATLNEYQQQDLNYSSIV